ncbi:uncharacterized protein DUF421 [Antricoccus suffuscus]|uniref:Uncharacterized protein DUF421 n=1 Tax=Antricoccus suffuscus TaxID=1629062 RepID=A0A2T0ZZL2_9ACTN|nr:YetF domain-containing protein [Antricoccus suffuscus]PRZ41677.1 uncharacterized protein DUF421 [Antricoccus suffuscus]
MWHSIFGLDLSIWEKLIRAVVIYVFLVIALRLAGKREMAQLTTVDFVVLLAVSNAVQNGLIGADNTVTGAVIGASALFLINAGAVYLFYRSQTWRHLLTGKTRMLVRDGEIDWTAMRKERFTKADLKIELQNAGIFDVANVKYARLEPNGTVLVTPKHPEGPTNQQLLHQLMQQNRRLEQSIATMQGKLDSLVERP